MNGIPFSGAPPVPGPVIYPCEDGKPLAETEVHILALLWLLGTLRLRYVGRSDVYVIGDMFLYYEEGNPEARKAPDVMVVKGAPPRERRETFKIWEEGVGPCVIFEVTSKSTADEDLGTKRELYQRLGVKEYFLFDPLGEYLSPPLQGYRLIRGVYEPLVAAADAGLLSNELQLRLRPEGSELSLYDFATGERLLTPPELLARAQEARQEYRRERERADRAEQERQRAEQERQRAEQERQRAEQERQRAEQERQRQMQRAEEAERRAAELEAEVARLRASLPAAGAHPTGG